MKHIFVRHSIVAITILMIFALMNRFHFITDNLLYGLYLLVIVYGFFFLLKKPEIYFKKAFLPYLFILLINIVALLFNPSAASVQYMVVKFGLLSISMAGIYYYRDYFVEKFPRILKNSLLFTLVLSIVLVPGIFGNYQGYNGIFGTRNELGLVAALVFGMILIERNFTKLNLFLLIFTSLLVLVSSSRAAIVGMVIAFMFAGFSWRRVLPIVMVAAAGMYMISHFKIESGLDRFASSEITSGRDLEFLYGLETWKQHPWIGWGLDKYAFIDQKVIPAEIMKKHFVVNPHNSYLGMYIQYGAPLATLILGMLVYFTGKVLLRKKMDKNIKLILLFTAINGIVETYIFGISGLPGFLFWFYLGLGLMVISDQKSKRKKAFR